jgi:hypothetical protein
MRSGLILCFLSLGWMNAGALEEAAPHPEPVISTTFIRTGERLQAPHASTYHMVEFEQQRGRWTFLDLGAYDEGEGQDKLVFAGAGADLRLARKVALTQEVYFVQDTGPGSQAARSLWIWPVFSFAFTPRLTAEAVAYPTIPLNRAAKVGLDVDRAKLEYALRRNFTLGAGYSSSKCEGTTWQNRPFLTTTLFSRSGSFEFWLERMPGGGQLQVRYKLVHSGR